MTPPRIAAQIAPGTIRGRLTNGTTDAAVSDLPVTLLAISSAGPGQRLTASPGPDGTFQFEDLKTDPSLSYVLWAEYQGSRYQVGPVGFDPQTTVKVIDIAVYEPTEIDPGIRVLRFRMAILPDPRSRTLTMVEVAELENPAKLAFVGKQIAGNPGKRESLRFSLPGGARNLEIVDGIQVNALVQTLNGFSDTLPVTPGIRQVSYQYVVDVLDNGVLLDKQLGYPTGEVVILVGDGRWSLTADGVKSEGIVDLQGQRFQKYSGQAFAGSASLRMVLRGEGLTTQPLEGRDIWQLTVGGLIVVSVVAGVGIPLARRRKRAGRSTGRKSEQKLPAFKAGEREDQYGKFVRAIAELDDRYEAGKLGEEEWSRLRAEKKSALIDLLRDARGI